MSRQSLDNGKSYDYYYSIIVGLFVIVMHNSILVRARSEQY